MKKVLFVMQLCCLVLLASCSVSKHNSNNNNNNNNNGNNNNSTSKIEVQNVYGRTGFMDQVQAAATDTDCVAADATDITDCLQTNGSWRVTVPAVTSCDGLAIAEALALFDWTCSDVGGIVVFNSTMKSSTSLASFLNPGAFKLNSLTIKNSSGTTIAYTEDAAWFTDTVQVLPVSTDGTDPIYLADAGIYTFGPSDAPIMTNTIGSTVDKTAIVGLQNAKLQFNSGCVDSGLGEPICITTMLSGNFDYIEGRFVSPPAEINKLNISVGVLSFSQPGYPRFTEVKNIEIVKNPDGTEWGTDNAPYGSIIAGSFNRITGTLTSTNIEAAIFGAEGMPLSSSTISADITSSGSYSPGIDIGNTQNCTFTGSMTVTNVTHHSGIYIQSTSNNVFQSNITLDTTGGFELDNNSTENEFDGTITITNTVGEALSLGNASSSNTFAGTINIDKADTNWGACLDIGGDTPSNPSSNSNIFTGALNLSNCFNGVAIRGSNNNVIIGLATIHDVNSAIFIANNAQSNSVSSVEPTNNVQNDVWITEVLGGTSPAGNTVTSYDASAFASCGTAPYLDPSYNNTTSCVE